MSINIQIIEKIMKKTYQAPVVEELLVEESSMICASIDFAGTTGDNEITVGESREFSELFDTEF